MEDNKKFRFDGADLVAIVTIVCITLCVCLGKC